MKKIFLILPLIAIVTTAHAQATNDSTGVTPLRKCNPAAATVKTGEVTSERRQNPEYLAPEPQQNSVVTRRERKPEK